MPLANVRVLACALLIMTVSSIGNSCANVTVRRLKENEITPIPLDNGAPSHTAGEQSPSEGVRFWRTHPYVVISKNPPPAKAATTDGHDNSTPVPAPSYSAQIIQLPDPE